MDSPNKYQYNKEDIQAFNGFDVERQLKLTKTEKNSMRKQARQYIRENDIIEIADLINYSDEENPSWAEIIESSTYPINTYITSHRNNPRHKFSQRNKDFKQIRDIIRENHLTDMAQLYDYIDSEAPDLSNLMNDSYLEVAEYLTNHAKNLNRSTEPTCVTKALSDSFNTTKQDNIIPLVPKGIDLELWALTIKEYQESCI